MTTKRRNPPKPRSKYGPGKMKLCKLCGHLPHRVKGHACAECGRAAGPPPSGTTLAMLAEGRPCN